MQPQAHIACAESLKPEAREVTRLAPTADSACIRSCSTISSTYNSASVLLMHVCLMHVSAQLQGVCVLYLRVMSERIRTMGIIRALHFMISAAFPRALVPISDSISISTQK